MKTLERSVDAWSGAASVAATYTTAVGATSHSDQPAGWVTPTHRNTTTNHATNAAAGEAPVARDKPMKASPIGIQTAVERAGHRSHGRNHPTRPMRASATPAASYSATLCIARCPNANPPSAPRNTTAAANRAAERGDSAKFTLPTSTDCPSDLNLPLSGGKGG